MGQNQLCSCCHQSSRIRGDICALTPEISLVSSEIRNKRLSPGGRELIECGPAVAHHTYFQNFCCGVSRSHLMTAGLSAPDAALVHGFRGSEEDDGEADNPETERHQRSGGYNSTESTCKIHFHNVDHYETLTAWRVLGFCLQPAPFDHLISGQLVSYHWGNARPGVQPLPPHRRNV